MSRRGAGCDELSRTQAVWRERRQHSFSLSSIPPCCPAPLGLRRNPPVCRLAATFGGRVQTWRRVTTPQNWSQPPPKKRAVKKGREGTHQEAGGHRVNPGDFAASAVKPSPPGRITPLHLPRANAVGHCRIHHCPEN